MIFIVYFNRVDSVPKNLNSVAKELFQIAVCLKPRLIRNGIERINSLSNTDDLESEDTGNIYLTTDSHSSIPF